MRRFIETGKSPDEYRDTKGLIPRKGGRFVDKVSVYLDPERARKLRIYCVEKRRDLSEVVDEMLAKFLGE